MTGFKIELLNFVPCKMIDMNVACYMCNQSGK